MPKHVIESALTKAAIGLGNVDNTSDVDKPVSIATQTALNGKAFTGGIIPSDLDNSLRGGWAVEDTIVPVGAARTYSTTINRYIGSNGLVANAIPLDARRTYRFSIDVYSSGAGQVSYISGNYLDKNKAVISASPYIGLANTVLPTTTWTTYSGFIGPTGTVVPPAGTAYFRPYIYANHANGTSGNTLYITGLTVLDVTEVSDIVRSSWYTASSTQHGVMWASDKIKLDAAVAGATPNTLMMRNASGEVAFATGTAAGNGATKGYVDTGLAGKEPTIAAGTTAQYRRGDKTWQTLDKAAVGLPNVENPITADLNLYVSTTGNNSNDGLTSGTAYLTIQKAVDVAAAKSLGNDKKVIINVAAGSYNGRVIIPEFTENRLNLTIQGPEVAHPSVPTVTQTEGTNASASAFLCRNPNVLLKVRNIHFTGYRGTSSSSGITVTGGTKLYTENCHFTDCFWGVSGQSSFTDVKGGIFTRCGFLGTSGTGTGAGGRSLMGNVHAYGTQAAGTLTLGPEFVDCKTGLHLQETSTGHVDYCTFKGTTERGVILRVNARANVDGSSFTGQSVGITVETGSNAFLSSATTFATCTNNYVVNSSGSVSGITHTMTGVEEAYVRQEALTWGKYTSTTHTGTLTETDLVNLTLKGGVWRENGFGGTNAPAARLRLQCSGTLNGSVGTKTIRIRYGTGIATVAFTATETGSFVYDGYVTFTAAAQILRAEGRRHLGTNMRIGTATTATDTTVDQTIRLTAQLGDTTDSIVFDLIEISRA